MKWVEVATELEDIRRVLTELGHEPRRRLDPWADIVGITAVGITAGPLLKLPGSVGPSMLGGFGPSTPGSRDQGALPLAWQIRR